MDDINKVIKSVKDTVTVDNIVSLMKDAKVIDDHRLNEEDVRKTLSKMDINKYVDVDEMKKKALNVAEQSKDTICDIQQQSVKVFSYAKDNIKDFNMFKVLNKAEVCPDCGIVANAPPLDLSEKLEHDNIDNVSDKGERKEEDAPKTEDQGKQFESTPRQTIGNLGVSAELDDTQKTDL